MDGKRFCFDHKVDYTQFVHTQIVTMQPKVPPRATMLPCYVHCFHRRDTQQLLCLAASELLNLLLLMRRHLAPERRIGVYPRAVSWLL